MLHLSKIISTTGALLLMLVSGCASVKYADDFKSGADFSQIKTYSWRAATVDIVGADKPGLQRMVDEQLQSQGYQLVDQGADVWVDLQLFSRVSKGGNTSIGIGLGLPIGRNGSIGLGTGKMLGQGKQEGVLVIDITEQTSNTLVWRGNAEGIPLLYFSLKSEPKLRENIRQLLMQFPPK
jgi:Domain of unknown function (DUF4136)